jgi:hypothetical protein
MGRRALLLTVFVLAGSLGFFSYAAYAQAVAQPQTVHAPGSAVHARR